MVSSNAATPEEYLRDLPAERAEVLAAVRSMVQEHLPAGYEEGMLYGMISWHASLELYRDTYNKRPLSYAGLAAQKNYTSLHLMALHAGGPLGEAQLRERWSAARPPDLGKGCVRFRSLADLDLPLLAEVVASVPLETFVAVARASREAPVAGGRAR